jgi:hypothetical protein
MKLKFFEFQNIFIHQIGKADVGILVNHNPIVSNLFTYYREFPQTHRSLMIDHHKFDQQPGSKAKRKQNAPQIYC